MSTPVDRALDRTPEYRRATPRQQRALMDALRAEQGARTCQCDRPWVDGTHCVRCGRDREAR